MASPEDIATDLDGLRQQFQEQIDFFRAKQNLPTERWDDILTRANDKAFYVAGAQKADLLTDLRAAVDKAVSGGSIGQFRKDFAQAVRKSGWSGWTGEGTKEGEAWRTRVIYQTNIATSYAAGRYKQLNDPDLVKVRPFWRYIHSDNVLTPRPQHKLWGDSNLTLPRDHPFWRTHFPPNGWGCQCRIKAVRGPSTGDATAPPEGWDTIDPKTGAPEGIDKGWAYAPGASATDSLRQMVQDKLITYPPAIGQALTKDANRFINATANTKDFVSGVLEDKQRKAPFFMGFVENPKTLGAVVDADLNGYILLLPADAPRHVFKKHQFDGNTQRLAQPSDYEKLPELVANPDAVQPGETINGMKRLVLEKTFGSEVLKGVFEVRPSQQNRALVLVTLVVKTGKE